MADLGKLAIILASVCMVLILVIVDYGGSLIVGLINYLGMPTLF